MSETILILNGKKAGRPQIREAVGQLRQEGHDLQVRVTWEYGDGVRYVEEAADRGVERIIAGGGDGTVNELAHGLARLEEGRRPVLGILPLGTANDFATGCGIPVDPAAALHLAVEATPEAVDLVQVNDRHFINVASAGFGAAVTTETPVELKNLLGGGAYTLMGILKLLNFSPYRVHLRGDGFEFDGEATVGAACNGRQAGGGQVMAPEAWINDGVFDVLVARPFPVRALEQLGRELKERPRDGEFISCFRTSWLESAAGDPVPLNLDGEPYHAEKIRFEILPGALRMALPSDCPCLLK